MRVWDVIKLSSKGRVLMASPGQSHGIGANKATGKFRVANLLEILLVVLLATNFLQRFTDAAIGEAYLFHGGWVEDIAAIEDEGGFQHVVVDGGPVIGFEFVPFGEDGDGVGFVGGGCGVGVDFHQCTDLVFGEGVGGRTTVWIASNGTAVLLQVFEVGINR